VVIAAVLGTGAYAWAGGFTPTGAAPNPSPSVTASADPAPSSTPSPTPSPTATAAPATQLPASCDDWLSSDRVPYISAEEPIGEVGAEPLLPLVDAELEQAMSAPGSLRCEVDSTPTDHGTHAANIRVVDEAEMAAVRSTLSAADASCVELAVGLVCVAASQTAPDDETSLFEEIHVLSGDVWIVVSIVEHEMITRGLFFQGVLESSPVVSD
jgi:hypothetical protein